MDINPEENNNFGGEKNTAKTWLTVLAILVIIFIVVAVIAYLGQSKRGASIPTSIPSIIEPKTPPSSLTANTADVSSLTENEGMGEENISIEHTGFNPRKITVIEGTEVAWTNNDNNPEQVVSNTGLFKSAKLYKGDIFTHKFEKVGVYKYHSAFYPNLIGEVVIISGK